MFGEQTPALAQLIAGAQSSPKLLLPKIGLPIAQPWARSVLLSPFPAATVTSAVRPALTGAGRAGLYTAVAQGAEPKPPGAGP